MAIIGKIINEQFGKINTREGEVLCDIIHDHEFFQIRTYSMADSDRKNGSKQNIQLTKEKAIQLKKHLEDFINQ
ncbi:hypothetical protein [Formosa sp. PL04]|uniref:hypothetical protein n=1 Tax=Formosa sp. PL04 TaxID=3081755 RepID=UPI002981F4A5|nr:hypothetical protein [Formosa sp. PL04]MDW5289276.1 hypothetical protein [Formosa sp. PL04]